MMQGRTAQWGASYLILLTIYNKNDQVKKDGIGRECSMHVSEEECTQVCGGK
jgi:hypothetical protein